jgi:glycosyltransferase involved in cell wall biosynthesis
MSIRGHCCCSTGRRHTTDRRDDVLTGSLRLPISGYELIDSNAVWLTTAQLAEPVLARIYRFSAAYLCSSLAEGQNQLLQEAMAWGVVPITTRHTAMLDYICEDNAAIISSQRHPVDRPDTANGHRPERELSCLHERRCRARIAALCRARRG